MNKKPLDLIELGLIAVIIAIGLLTLLGACAQLPRTYTKSELLRGLDNGTPVR